MNMHVVMYSFRKKRYCQHPREVLPKFWVTDCEGHLMYRYLKWSLKGRGISNWSVGTLFKYRTILCEVTLEFTVSLFTVTGAWLFCICSSYIRNFLMLCICDLHNWMKLKWPKMSYKYDFIFFWWLSVIQSCVLPGCESFYNTDTDVWQNSLVQKMPEKE